MKTLKFTKFLYLESRSWFIQKAIESRKFILEEYRNVIEDETLRKGLKLFMDPKIMTYLINKITTRIADINSFKSFKKFFDTFEGSETQEMWINDYTFEEEDPNFMDLTEQDEIDIKYNKFDVSSMYVWQFINPLVHAVDFFGSLAEKVDPTANTHDIGNEEFLMLFQSKLTPLLSHVSSNSSEFDFDTRDINKEIKSISNPNYDDLDELKFDINVLANYLDEVARKTAKGLIPELAEKINDVETMEELVGEILSVLSGSIIDLQGAEASIDLYKTLKNKKQGA